MVNNVIERELIRENNKLNAKLRRLKDKKLVEILADIEHTRWSKWQRYVHDLCIKNTDGSLTIPAERVKHWENEINTDYKDLTETIKEFDRKEVRITLSVIDEYIGKKFN